MSTVPEVVAGRDEGMRVLVLSLVTNMVVGVVRGTGVRSVREELDAEVRHVEGRSSEVDDDDDDVGFSLWGRCCSGPPPRPCRTRRF